MFHQIIITTFLLILTQSALAERAPFDIDFYGSRSDYDQLYNYYRQNKMELLGQVNGSPTRDLDTIVELGRRNLQWLDHLNQFRPENPLTFSSEQTQKGIPIEEPMVYGPSTIYPEHESLLNHLPEQMKRVLVDLQPFEDQLQIEDEQYELNGRKLDRLYQITVRWLSLSGWKNWYAGRKRNDVRGYYFLSKRENLTAELNEFSNLPIDVQNELTPLLINICENSMAQWRRCPDLFNDARESNQLNSYYHRYIDSAEATYNEFFRLDVRRSDTHWNSDQQMDFPFQHPNDVAVKSWLIENIQDEWQWEDWKLVLDFSNSARPRVRFLPNVTPNVNGLGGNIITMNSLNSLEDYNTRWTIRHEFGHVLGFPDCYVEFYDEPKNLMVNYQIDITNLMCSRRGKLKETHHNELKRVYDRRASQADI
ncbi:MAG: hypothetical protein R2827_09820 [Bdellovibrionales bacterium]